MIDEDRIITIETKIAYQEDLVQALSGVIERQQRQITALEQRYRDVIERLGVSREARSAHGVVDEIPPHY